MFLAASLRSLWHTPSPVMAWASAVVAHGLSCSTACEILVPPPGIEPVTHCVARWVHNCSMPLTLEPRPEFSSGRFQNSKGHLECTSTFQVSAWAMPTNISQRKTWLSPTSSSSLSLLLHKAVAKTWVHNSITEDKITMSNNSMSWTTTDSVWFSSDSV